MPRFNVQHPVTKEWRCFSTTVDDYVTDWMDEERYQKWRLHQYGQNAGEIRDANLMDYEEAEQIIADRKRWEAEDEVGRERDMKYILEIKPEYEAKGIMILGARDSHLYVTTLEVKDLEELNSDYINEHFGWLQDDAYERGHGIGYQKGFEDGKAVNDKGCEGCKYEGRDLSKLPCMVCSNSRKNCWTAKQTDDVIKVGDEVAFHHDDDRPDTVVVVTYIGQDGFIDGMDGRGTQYAHKNPTKWTKTGRHFDIASILKEMQS